MYQPASYLYHFHSQHGWPLPNIEHCGCTGVWDDITVRRYCGLGRLGWKKHPFGHTEFKEHSGGELQPYRAGGWGKSGMGFRTWDSPTSGGIRSCGDQGENMKKIGMKVFCKKKKSVLYNIIQIVWLYIYLFYIFICNYMYVIVYNKILITIFNGFQKELGGGARKGKRSQKHSEKEDVRGRRRTKQLEERELWG